MMKSSPFVCIPALLITGSLFAQEAKVTTMMSKDLPDFPGKEGLMITVVYPPGASDPVHRRKHHDAGQIRRLLGEE